MIPFKAYRPSLSLRPYIKMYFWGHDNIPPKIRRMVPYGETALCIYKINGVTYNGSAPHHLCLSGPTNTFQEIAAANGQIEVIVVHFTKLGAHLT